MKRKSTRKESSILTSALELFSKQGFYNTTIADIAGNLNISVGGIYRYFPSKKNIAKASISLVTKKLARNLQYINNQKITTKEKILKFVTSYFEFTHKHPEMIEYFFKVYLSNRELFCEDDKCGFALAKEFIDEVERLINDGINNGDFREQNFYVSFSCIVGILGGMTFLKGEKVLETNMLKYSQEITNTIIHALEK